MVPVAPADLPSGTKQVLSELSAWMKRGGTLGNQTCDFAWQDTLTSRTLLLLGELLAAITLSTRSDDDLRLTLYVAAAQRQTGDLVLFRNGCRWTSRALQIPGLAGFATKQTLKDLEPDEHEADSYLKQQWRCFLAKTGPFDEKNPEAVWLYKIISDRLSQAGVGYNLNVDGQLQLFAQQQKPTLFARINEAYRTVDDFNQLMAIQWRGFSQLRERYETLLSALPADEPEGAKSGEHEPDSH